jgi:hypothetical protein
MSQRKTSWVFGDLPAALAGVSSGRVSAGDLVLVADADGGGSASMFTAAAGTLLPVADVLLDNADDPVWRRRWDSAAQRVLEEAYDGSAWRVVARTTPSTGLIELPNTPAPAGWVPVYSVDLTALGSVGNDGVQIVIAGVAWDIVGNPTINATDGLTIPGGAANTSYAANSSGTPVLNRAEVALASLVPSFDPADDWRIWVEFDSTDGDQASECCVAGIDTPSGVPVSGYSAVRATIQKGFGTTANRWNFGGFGLGTTQQNVYTSRTVGVLELSDGGNSLNFWAIDSSGISGDFAARSPAFLGRAARGSAIVNPGSGVIVGTSRLLLGAITGNTANNFTARFRGLRIDRRFRA